MEIVPVKETTASIGAMSVYNRMTDPIAAVKEMGKMFAASGMFGVQKEEQGQVIALACLIEGKSPFEIMQRYHVIGGSLSMKATAALAEFQKKGGSCEWLSALNNTDEARANFSIVEGSKTRTLDDAVYTIEDAKREGLVTGPNKHNWTARPSDMLRARLITKAIRMLAPGIFMGLGGDTDPMFQTEPPPPVRGELLEPNGEPSKPKPEEAEMTLEERLSQDEVPIGDVIDFLRKRGTLEADKDLSSLTKGARSRIMKNYHEFVSRVTEHGAAMRTPPAQTNE
jgi:hypothetical protein